MRWIALVLLFAALRADAQTSGVIYIGDSITEGLGLSDHEQAYPELLGGVNAGVSGSSTWWWVPENYPLLEEHVLPHLPAKQVSIMLGTNDSNGFLLEEPTLPAIYYERMQRIIRWLLVRGVESITLRGAPIPRTREGVPRPDYFRFQRYREADRQLCEAYPAVHCGVFLNEVWDPKIRDYAPPDWLHPSQDGHISMADLIRNDPAGLRPINQLGRNAADGRCKH